VGVEHGLVDGVLFGFVFRVAGELHGLDKSMHMIPRIPILICPGSSSASELTSC
jgi:hypothetical protein